jgi:hypothetical protein
MTDAWKELRLKVPPLSTRNVPIRPNRDSRRALGEGRPVILRFTFMDPQGYVLTTADTMVVPRRLKSDVSARGGDFVLEDGRGDG